MANGVGSNTTIRYNPNINPFGYAALDESTGRIYHAEKPNYISLGHELIHAYGHTTGTRMAGTRDFDYINALGVTVTVNVNNEELVTIGLIAGRPITENDLLREHLLAPRGTYER